MQTDKKTNSLINESSPYLLQHAYNPVDWYPWGEEALNKAKAEDKMLIISIGYAACHWCHVMEHESFEDSLVAQIMNDNFVCIKVDREERPDVDDVYMTACHLSGGRSCGWPLNAFALPDGRPVWAGTYFPKENWITILEQFIDLKKKDLAKLERSAEGIMKGISNYGAVKVNSEKSELTQNEIIGISKKFIASIDMEKGGRKGSPKFPMPNNYEFLLKYAYLNKDENALGAVTTTLDNMAAGGIYDQIKGGFARYSTDENWKVPHFEKMLYDNGQILGLYADAYAYTGKARYLEVVEETISFLKDEMLDESNGFYSSFDADSEGTEGKYYVWEAEEVSTILGNDFEVFAEYYNVKSNANWEEGNILYNTESNEEVIKNNKLGGEAELTDILRRCKKILSNVRDKRVKPGLDDKVLASWNGLMLNGLVKAYNVSGDQAHLDLAINNATFLLDKMIQSDGSILRNFKNGKSSINGFLDDYGNVIAGFIQLYQSTFDVKWLNEAKKLQVYCDEHFWDETIKMYDYTNKLNPPLIAKPANYSDNVIPAGNSITARNLYLLGTLFSDNAKIERSKAMLSNVMSLISGTEQPSFYSNWLQLYLDLLDNPYEIAILGEDALGISQEMQKKFIPDAVFLGGNEENLPLLEYKLEDGKTKIYVCKNKVCKFPVTEIKDAIALIK